MFLTEPLALTPSANHRQSLWTRQAGQTFKEVRGLVLIKSDWTNQEKLRPPKKRGLENLNSVVTEWRGLNGFFISCCLIRSFYTPFSSVSICSFPNVLYSTSGASETADTLFQEVLGRKDKADSTRNALNVLQRFKFLFNLPLNIERNIQKVVSPSPSFWDTLNSSEG